MASDVIDIKTFSGSGLNSDSDLLAIQGADSRYRLNVILSEDSNYEVLSNVQGNTLRNYSLPSGINQVKGFVEDKENKAGIHFIWNSNDDHAIVRFNSEDDTFTEILVDQSVILPAYASGWVGFADAEIIGNEDEQFLVWADGDFLKMINIKFAIDGNYNDPITEEEISFYKNPLTTTLSANILASYSSGSANIDLTNKIFQFAIRLKYYDNTFSTLSNYSEIAVPEENIPSGRITSDYDYNSITVSYYIANEPIIVDKIQLAYRVVDVGGGVAGSWYLYDEINHTSKGNKTWSFKNDKSIGIISDDEASRPYDYVPDKVSHIGIIDSNRVVTDVGQEGYDNVAIDVSLDVSDSAISTPDEGLVSNTFEVLTNANPVTISQSVISALDYYMKVSMFGIGSNYDFSLYTFGLDGVQIGADIKDYFDSQSIGGLTIVDNSTNLLVDLDLTLSSGSYFVEKLVLQKCPTFRTLKTGAKYKYGLEYSYNGKRGTVQTNDDCILEVPDFAEVKALGYDYTNYLLNAEITINHVAPVGATEFRIVSFGSNVDYIEEYPIAFNFDNIADGSSDYTCYLENNFTVIKRDDIINRMRLAYGDEANGIDYGFDFQVGDYIKFVGYFEEPPISSIALYDVALTENIEFRIDVATSTELKTSSSAIRKIKDLTPNASRDFWLIQIIRKKETFDAIAQEFSPSIPIQFHNATYDITSWFSDIWKSKQVYANENNSGQYSSTSLEVYAWMEKPKISLYYDSYPLSQGRVNAVNEFAEQRSDRRIRWGGKFIDEAGVNFLTKFDAEDSRELDDRNGVINKIQQIGNVLKVYQERKVTSFYLKTTSSIDADGNDTFVFDNAVMSIGRQAIEDYGCTHFSSYIKNVRNAYFFDIINGAVVRDSANGFQEISNNLMHSYFKQKSRDILEYNGTVSVFGGWDEDLEMYMITFVDLSDLGASINATLGFHEPTNRWMSFYSFLPEYYGKISGDQLLSFRAGALYEHNINSVRNNFYSVQYGSEVRIHSNKEAILNKIFNSIEINSVNQWDCPDDDSIEIERPIVMQSRLMSGKFKKQEGIYRAEFLRDNLNGGSSPSRINLLNGRQLRGKEVTIKLKNTDTEQSLIESVIIKSSISK